MTTQYQGQDVVVVRPATKEDAGVPVETVEDHVVIQFVDGTEKAVLKNQITGSYVHGSDRL